MIFGAFLNWRYRAVWANEFDNNYHRVITPDAPAVLEAAEEIDNSQRPVKVVVDVWEWVTENINYVLTDSWRSPQEVIESGKGDCEDVSFTILSICLALDIEYMYVVLGRLKYPNKSRPPENHVWLEYDGYIIDGTVNPDSITNASRYVEIDTYKILNEQSSERLGGR